MSITRVRDHIVKHHKYAWMFTVLSLLVIGGVYFKKEFLQAATFSFTQSSTTGGWATLSADTASHNATPSNQTNWSKYSASTGVTPSASGVSLSPTSYTATDDGVFATSTVSGSGTSLATKIDSYTKLLLHADGTDGSTTFIDETGKTVTTYGNAQIDTAQSKFGGASGLFDGLNDRLRLTSTDFNIVDGTPMAIDLWIRLNDLPASGKDWVMMAQATYGVDQAWYLMYRNVGGTRHFFFGVQGILETMTYDIDLSINTWYHIAVTKDPSNTFRMFLDGALVGTPVVATGFPAIGYINIGDIVSPSNQHSFNGWMDEIRFSQGDARWTANFTPPTSAYSSGSYSNTTVTGSGAGASVGLEPSGALTALATPTIATELTPYDIAISADGASVYAVNYSSSTVSMYSRNASTGALTALATPSIASGLNPVRIAISADGASVYAVNYNANTVSMYSRNASTGALTALATPTIATGGTLPQGIAISADGASVYVDSPPNVSMFSRNASTGALTALATPTIAVSGANPNPYDIAISADGASVYVTNANSSYNEVNMYSRNASTGALTALATPTIATGGTWPFGIAISADGASVYVANLGSNTVSMFSRNASTGALTALATPTIATGVEPIDIAISADGDSVYAVNNGSNTVSMFSRNASTGALTALATPTIASGLGSYRSAISADGASVYVINNGTNTVSMFSRKIRSSGTFESATIDLGAKANLSTLDFTSTIPAQSQTSCTASTGAGCALKFQVSANNDNSTWTYLGPDGTASTYFTSSAGSGETISSLNGNRYFRYKAYLATADAAYTPTLDSLTLYYTQYATSGTLTSSKYDVGSSSNVIGNILWSASGTTADRTAKLQVRSATTDGGLDTAPWCGQSSCSGSTYFTTSNTANSTLSAATGDHQWFQYKVFLDGDSYGTPTLTSVTVKYVVNAPPLAGNVLVSQISDSANVNYGKVAISYDVSDADTSTGATVNTVTPTKYEYSVNGGTSWTTICTSACSALSSNAFTNITLTGDAATSTSPQIIWGPTGTNAAVANAKIRVTVSDNEGANATATALSGLFTLDSIVPAIGAGNVTLNSSTAGATGGTITFTATDDNTMQYRLCNNNTFPTAGDAQLNTCAWSFAVATYASTTITSHVLTGYPSNETVYMEVRDLYGNTTSKTLVAPTLPGSFDFKDVSNTNINVYREFLSWAVFADVTGSTFTSYKIYEAHTADGSTPTSGAYSVLTTITNRAVNYYTHDITAATSSTYFYKVVALDTDGDISNETEVFSDIPNGTGGATEVPPVITDTPATDVIKNTSARIAFTTDILATSEVQYRTSSGGSWQSALETSYTKSHSVYLNNLYTSTAYDIRVKVTSAAGLASDWKTGTSFTTVSGPVITGVTTMDITDKNATIFWNTSASSTSKVYYGTGRSGSTLTGQVTVSGADAVTAGTNGLYQHQVGIPTTGSLTAGVTYYYKVESTSRDGQSITTTDDNNGQFYSFATTLDTTAPTVNNIEASVIAPDSAVIVWTTDEPATSQVKYSGTMGNHGKKTETTMSFAGVPSYAVYHVVTLSGQTDNTGEGGGKNTLSHETPYYYTVVSADAAGNETESAEQTFTTTKTGETVVVTRRITELPQGTTVPDTTAPVISNMKAADTTPFGATITFDTDEGAVGKVGYGKDTSYGDNASDDFSWATSHTIKLRGLTLGTEYHFTISAVDKAGNTGTSGDQTFKTSFLTENLKDLTKIENIEQYQKELEETIASILPSLIPPFVGKPQIADITESGATISFKTNIKAFPVVGYVEDGAYNEANENPYTGEISDTTAKAVNHTLALVNLKPNTKYHIQARAFSLPQVIGKSEDYTFATKASKIQGSIVERKRDSFTVVWITDEPTSSIVEYKNLKSGITERKSDDTKTSSHSMKIENLPSATSYEVNISGVNAVGNLVEGGSALSVTTSKDVTPPVLSGFKVSNAMVPGRTDRIQTIISWETDEPADSVVYYEEGIGTAGEEARELANKVESLDAYVVDHNLIVSSLKPGTIYRIKVTSRDDSGNLGSFGPRTIITPKQTESITDIIFKNFEDSFKFLRQM